MTDAEIAHLLTTRNKILMRRDGLIDSKRIDRIDAKLRTVAPGVNNEVDKALGRLCAVLERFAPRPGWFVNQAVTLELSAAEIADMEARTKETETEAPDYPGMWM